VLQPGETVTAHADKECPVPEPFRANLGSIVFIAALFFMTFVGRFIFAPLMPTIVKELGITPGQAGSLFLMISLGMFFAQVFSGFLSSRINHRGALIVSIFVVGFALLAFLLSSELWVIRGILFLLGMGAGIHIPSAIAAITAMVTRQDWGKALAVHQTAPPLSLVIGPFLTILLLTWISWQTILAVLGAAAAAVGFAFMRFERCGRFPGDAPRPAAAVVVLKQRSFWIMVALFALAMGGGTGIYTMLSLYLVGERGFAGDWANTLLGLSRVSGLFMTFVAGWFTDRLGEKIFIFIVMFVSGIATILLGSLSGVWLVAIIFIQPAVVGCYFTAGFSALSRIVQPNLRSIAAAFTPPSAFLIGGGLLPTLIGYMGEKHSFGLAIALIGGLMVLASGLVFFLKLIEKMENGC